MDKDEDDGDDDGTFFTVGSSVPGILEGGGGVGVMGGEAAAAKVGGSQEDAEGGVGAVPAPPPPPPADGNGDFDLLELAAPRDPAATTSSPKKTGRAVGGVGVGGGGHLEDVFFPVQPSSASRSRISLAAVPEAGGGATATSTPPTSVSSHASAPAATTAVLLDLGGTGTEVGSSYGYHDGDHSGNDFSSAESAGEVSQGESLRTVGHSYYSENSHSGLDDVALGGVGGVGVMGGGTGTGLGGGASGGGSKRGGRGRSGGRGGGASYAAPLSGVDSDGEESVDPLDNRMFGKTDMLSVPSVSGSNHGSRAGGSHPGA